MSIRLIISILILIFGFSVNADNVRNESEPSASPSSPSNTAWKPIPNCKLMNMKSVAPILYSAPDKKKAITQVGGENPFDVEHKFGANQVYPQNGNTEANVQEADIGGVHWFSFRFRGDVMTYFVPAPEVKKICTK